LLQKSQKRINKPMANAEVNVEYGSNGEKKVEKEIESLDKRLRGFADKNFGLALTADAAMGLTGQLTNAARAAYEFAKQGAATSSVAAEFATLDSKIGNVIMSMKEQAAESLVNSGAMNVAANRTETLGQSFEAVISILEVFGPVLEYCELAAKVMYAPLWALGEAFSWLGDQVGITSGVMRDLFNLDFDFPNATKEVDTFADSFQRMNDILVKGQLEAKMKTTSDSIKEAFSDKATRAEIDAIADALLNMQKNGVEASDIQVTLGDQLRVVSKDIKEYEENLLRVNEAIAAKKGSDIESIGVAYKATQAVLTLAQAAKTTEINFEDAKKPLIDFSAIGAGINTILKEGARAFGGWLKEVKTSRREIQALGESANVALGVLGLIARDLNSLPKTQEILWTNAKESVAAFFDYAESRSKDFAERSVEAFLSGASIGAAVSEEVAIMQFRDEQMKQFFDRQKERNIELGHMSEEGMQAAQWSEISAAMEDQISVAKPLSDTIMGTIGAVAEVGWFQAGLNAAMETGLGIATILQPLGNRQHTLLQLLNF
jgi:hypothetical protein